MLSDKKFSSDVLFNLASLSIVGSLGIAINIIIAKLQGPQSLGLFNQVFAAYILFSQLGAFGIQYSVLKGVAEAPKQSLHIFTSALFLTIGTASISTFLYLLCAISIEDFLGSEFFAEAVFYSAPGLFFFSLNKVLIATFNGIRSMKSFAFYNALRYTSLVLFILFLILNNFSPSQLLLSLSATELLLFLAMFIHLQIVGLVINLKVDRKHFTYHFFFGLKSFPGGLITELNTKVDILMLGVFLSDKLVGVYSFAAILSEGFGQILVVVRNNCNPLIAQHIANSSWKELAGFLNTIKVYNFLFFLLVATIAAVVYPWAISLLNISDNFDESYYVFLILLAGLLIHSPYSAGIQIPQLGGFPGHQTLFFATVVLVNIVANIVLIPHWGLMGAAIATSISFASSNLIIKIFVRKIFKIALI